MKPEFNSRRLFGITRSKGKMYEFGLPKEKHIAIPDDSVPEQLLLLTVGTLGDAAAGISDSEQGQEELEQETLDDLHFASSYFDALFTSRLLPTLDGDILMLASATYYLGNRPGSSIVMAKALQEYKDTSPLVDFLHWLLNADWSRYPAFYDGIYNGLLDQLAKHMASHYRDGSGIDDIKVVSQQLREHTYAVCDAQDLLLADLVCAIVNRRIYSSSWVNLPRFSKLSVDDWTPVIQKETFPKELWPSQMMLGQAGLFSGVSGLVQMPTSAGKTRSIEMILRSAFMSGRTSFAIVVAPFRALSHEISQSLLNAFKGEEIKVDELSDAFQPDYLDQFMELLGTDLKRSPSVIVLTPEKLLYVLRQNPDLTGSLGLVVYDEGHQFDTGYRGVTYELLLTEIKRLLPDEAQTVLISAVIQNADAIAQWLMDENAAVIIGKDLLPTSRSVAFASWAEKLGQMQFYEGDIGRKPDYFVPRVIQEQELNLLGKERKPQFFPAHGDVKDIALYIGLHLAPNGAVAVFCGRKDTTNKIVSRSIDIFARGLNISPPSAYSDKEEIRRLGNLYMLHFGESADSTKATGLGIFAHHGNTPHGIRLAIEYAMQQGLIKFVACTSTLAQGVNLPIRYLILSGVQQGAERIRIRDFHNLMGRAGRSGMHTEGLVIFADTSIYDGRFSKSERWRFNSAIELLDPTQTEPTSSSLLTIFAPFYSGWQEPVPVDTGEILNILLSDSDEKRVWAKDFLIRYADYNFDEKALIRELDNRRKLITALENYLMANRGESPYEEFIKEVDQLVAETLAFSLADDAQKTALMTLFLEVAKFIENREPEHLRQAVYAKTLLGVEVARNFEE